MMEIERIFAPVNAVAEVTQRHAAAVLGHEPAWSFAPVRPLKDGEEPTAAEQALIAEAEAALTVWWDARGAHTTLQAACIALLLAGRAPLRLFVPAGLLETTETGLRVPTAPLDASLARIYLETPDPTACRVVRDPLTLAEAGVYHYNDDDGNERAEMTYLDTDGKTIVRVLGGDDEQAAALDLGGRLTIYEQRGDMLITEPVRRQQDHLNMHHTMMGRNGVLAGFVSRIFFNAQLPEVLDIGGGTTNNIVGVPIYDQAGQPAGYATPNYVREEPVSPVTFIEAQRATKFALLEQTHQLHALLDGDGALSGESRKQARADFELSILPTAAQAARAIRWLLETALTMAAAFSGQAGRYAGLRAVVTLRTDTGPVSADDQQAARENKAAGLLSLATAMARVGVDDPDAEAAAIAAEQAERADAAPRAPTDTAEEGDTVPMEGEE